MIRHTILFLLLFFGSCSIVLAQHLKKDGTPDRRYHENQSPSVTSAPNASSSSHLKKDGTPDRRYHENRQEGNSSPAPAERQRAVPGVERDSHGRIKRSRSAREQFMKETGYPHGRPGYVIDHIKPLKEGGCDCKENMQWQTIQDAKEKDRWE